MATNGGFESGFTGWSVTGGGELNPGSSYNSRWPSGTHTIELDVSGNENYTQSYNLAAGLYLFTFQYAAREGYSMETNSMNTYWNGALL